MIDVGINSVDDPSSKKGAVGAVPAIFNTSSEHVALVLKLQKIIVFVS